MKKIVSIILVTILLQTVTGLTFDEHFIDDDVCTVSMIMNVEDDCGTDLDFLVDCCQDHIHIQKLETEALIEKIKVLDLKCKNISGVIPESLSLISPLDAKIIYPNKRNSHLNFNKPKIYLLNESYLC